LRRQKVDIRAMSGSWTRRGTKKGGGEEVKTTKHRIGFKGATWKKKIQKPENRELNETCETPWGVSKIGNFGGQTNSSFRSANYWKRGGGQKKKNVKPDSTEGKNSLQTGKGTRGDTPEKIGARGHFEEKERQERNAQVAGHSFDGRVKVRKKIRKRGKYHSMGFSKC